MTHPVQRAPHGANEHQALRQAAEETALPRHWPTWVVVVIALVVVVSHFCPWGFAQP